MSKEELKTDMEILITAWKSIRYPTFEQRKLYIEAQRFIIRKYMEICK